MEAPLNVQQDLGCSALECFRVLKDSHLQIFKLLQ